MLKVHLIEHALRCAYQGGTHDEGLFYLENRLRSRKTFIEWDKEILGPINVTLGVEQGGCASDRIYRLVNNEQLETAQQSELGVDIGLVVTSGGGLVKQILSDLLTMWGSSPIPPSPDQDLLCQVSS